MKSSKKQRHVTRESILPNPQRMLTEMGEAMIELASKLSNDGEGLTQDERDMIRFANLPILNEIMADLKAQYIATGYMDTYELEVLKKAIE